MPKQNNRKTNVPRKPKAGAYLVYSWRKAQAAYHSPLGMLSEALALCNWKNIRAEDLDGFKDQLNKKIKEVRQGKKIRKRLAKKGIRESGKCYVAYQAWRRKHHEYYDKDFYRDVWCVCWRRGVEPEWVSASSTLPGTSPATR